MTQRLYYDNCYMKQFDAVVLECREEESGYAVRLDRTAFYPTSGGQPYDTGMLGMARVTDVSIGADGEIWHTVDVPLELGMMVTGQIDWERRFDHMQQHAGEHMIANTVYRKFSGTTIGLHLGTETSTIDVTMPDGRTHLTPEEIRAIEDDVNARIQRDVPIRCWMPGREELQSLPLRKAPAVDEQIRVVQIGELEFCACGGTHPSSAGQIGLVKIVDARPSRGKLRIGFVCGKRAYELLRTHYDVAKETAELLSTSVGNLPNAVGSMAEQLKNAERSLAEARRKLLFLGIPEMLDRAAVSTGGVAVVAEEVDADAVSARELAAKIVEQENRIAIIAAPAGEGYVYAVSRSAGVDVHIGALLSSAAKACGGKGGGRPDLAQGGGPIQMLTYMQSEVLRNL